MADGTQIQWCDATWPIVQGCDPVSPGCAHCYVPKELWRMMHNPDPKIAGPIAGTAVRRDGVTKFTGKVALREDRLDWPLAWRKPRMIFLPSHGDIFHDAVPDEFLNRIFARVAMCPQHTLQVLTKRIARAHAYFTDPRRANQINGQIWSWLGSPRGSKVKHDNKWRVTLPLKNVWLGVSVERQPEADERIPTLLQIPAALHWISREPGLAPTDLRNLRGGTFDALSGIDFEDIGDIRDGGDLSKTRSLPGIGWVVDGGESGSDRPFDLDASRALEAQCVTAGVPYFRKQLGSCPFERKVSAWPDHIAIGGDADGRVLLSGFNHKKAGDPAEWPVDLRRREFPRTVSSEGATP